MNNVYQIVTDQILSLLDRGVIPWKKTWNCKTALPRNMVSGKAYKGINVWLLIASGYESPYWLTFKQVQSLHGSVRKNEKSSIVVYWNLKVVQEVNQKTGEPETKKIPFLRYYRVFNTSQCEGIELQDQIVETIYPLKEAEHIVACYENRPQIKHGFTRAAYSILDDQVMMPHQSAFSSIEEYYATLFHELTHSTGHQNRLNRENFSKRVSFGSADYSREELIAEMGAAFLCGLSGIEQATIENSAAYIESWRPVISKDPKLVVMAAAQAQKAVNHICALDENKDFEDEASKA